MNSQYYNESNETSKDSHEDFELEQSEEEEAETADTDLWTIEDDKMFTPIGLVNHGSSGKTVFAVWSENYLLNFIFKKSKKTNQVKMTKVRLSMPSLEQQEDSEIIEILILELNTLLLMRSGRVYFFSSVKSMRLIPWLDNVSCISKSQLGFSVIRVLPNNTICLEVYRDILNLGKRESTLVQQFDITFDESNIFNCQWRDEQFALLTQRVDNENLEFMQRLVRKAADNVKVEQEIHFFTVTGNVFVLIPDAIAEESNPTPEYHIQLLATYATAVQFLHIHCERKLFLVFLQCGIIDIWFLSAITKRVQRTTYNTGTLYAHYAYASMHANFYYTDEYKITCLQFCYDQVKDMYFVQETCKAIPGMLACTWIETIQQLICLSCNNVFYQLTFENNSESHLLTKRFSPNAATAEYENITELYELTPAKIAKLLHKANVVNNLLQTPQKLHEAIEQEYVKQQLIAVATKKRSFIKLFETKLIFTMQLPSIQQQDTLLIYTHNNFLLHSNNIFALIYLRIAKNDIFQATLWNLHIDYAMTTHICNLPSTLLHNHLCIVIPLIRKSNLEILPNINLKLIAFVAANMDFICISLPITVQVNESTYADLFSCTTQIFNLNTVYNLRNLVRNFGLQSETNKTAPSASNLISYSLKLPAACTFQHILSLFKTTATNGNYCFNIYFISTQVQLSYSEEKKSICLESTDVLALYYMKLHLYNNLKKMFSTEQTASEYEHATMQQLLMQYQCDVERCYGTLMQMNNEGDTTTSSSLHLEYLKRVYTKIRSEYTHLLR